MQVFVIITRFMNATQEGPIFSFAEAAKKFLAGKAKEGDPAVCPYTVLGDLVEPGVVFTASWYDPLADIHHFDGVYGSSDAATRAAGERGIVLTRRIDEQLSE